MLSTDRIGQYRLDLDQVVPLEIQINGEIGRNDNHLHRHEDPLHYHKPKEQDIEEDIETYIDMQMLNPDWSYAVKHAQATRPGLKGAQHQKQECICCFKQINKHPVPLCQNSKELEFLGFGFPLYFLFVKYALIILLLEIVNYTGIELYWAIARNYSFCVDNVPRVLHGVTVQCTSFMILLATVDEHLATEQHILRLSSFVTLLLALIYLRDHFTKIWQYYDERETNYEDFSVFIENLPKRKEFGDQTKIGRRLRQFFNDENVFPGKPRIAHINLIGEFLTLYEFQEEKKKYMHELEKITHKSVDLTKKYNQKGMTEAEKEQIYQQKAAIRKRKREICHKVKDQIDNITKEKSRIREEIENEDLNCDKAIICFETQRQMQQVLKSFQRMTNEQSHHYFLNHHIVFGPSARPRQINWEFININEAYKIKRQIISWVIFILILGALTVGVYFLFNWKTTLVLHADPRDATIIIFVSIIGILLFNKLVLSYIIHLLVQFQMKKTGVGYQFSYMLKYSLGLFFTTAVMTILVEGVTHDNVFEEKFGIVEEETLFFFFIALFIPLVWLVNPWYLWRLFQRKKHQKSPFVTQEEANHLMEDPEYIMGKRYGEILESFWFCFLYACVIPIGSICIFVGLSLFYWIDKYNLLRKSSITEGVSATICLQALTLLELVLIIKPAGELIFDGLIRHEWNVIPVIEIILGFIYLILPTGMILNFIHPQKFNATETTYSQLKKANIFSYELFNPLSKQIELKKYFNSIEMCSNEEHQHSRQNINPARERDDNVYQFVRPHESIRKKIDLFSESDFETEKGGQGK